MARVFKHLAKEARRTRQQGNALKHSRRLYRLEEAHLETNAAIVRLLKRLEVEDTDFLESAEAFRAHLKAVLATLGDVDDQA